MKSLILLLFTQTAIKMSHVQRCHKPLIQHVFSLRKARLPTRTNNKDIELSQIAERASAGRLASGESSLHSTHLDQQFEGSHPEGFQKYIRKSQKSHHVFLRWDAVLENNNINPQIQTIFPCQAASWHSQGFVEVPACLREVPATWRINHST